MRAVLLGILCLLPAWLAGQADFSTSVRQGCVPLTVNFTDNSTGAVRWLWDFGNGNTSTLQNPSAIYYASGTFSISLTVWDGSGNKSSITKSNYLRVFKNPKALFTASPNPACPADPVSFSSAQSTPGDTDIVRYSWDFGNGSTSSKANPAHTYNNPGTYNISLVVTDGHGCQDKILVNRYILIKPGPKALYTVDSGYNCKVPSGFWFQNKSTGGSLSYLWNFGDGSNSTQKSPSHTYSKEGIYSPSLTVTDTNGCSATYTMSGAIYLGPVTADFTGSPLRYCGSGPVQFNITGGPKPSFRYEWDFGDGSSETKASPSHYYKNPGLYSVTLKAVSVYRNCSTTVSKSQYVRIDPMPRGKISISDSFPCKPPFQVSLEYHDDIPIQTVQWEYFRDKNYFQAGTGKRIDQTVLTDETRLYRAIVTTSQGCTDTIELNWEVQGDMLKAVFSADSLGCKPHWSHFTDRSESKYPIVKWQWKFHDGVEMSSAEADYFYPDTGNFPVKLIVTTSKNCVDSAYHQIHVGLKTDPVFYVGNLYHICNNSDPVYFYNATKNPGFEIDSFRWVYDDSGKTTRKIPLSQKSYKSTNVIHFYDRDTGMAMPWLISYHNGCADSFYVKDSIFIRPPYASIRTSYDPCGKDSLLVRHRSTGADSLIWIVEITDMFHILKLDTLQFHKDSFWLPRYNYYNIILRTYNHGSGCSDTAVEYFDPPGEPTFCKPDLSSSCAPATLEMCINEIPAALRYFWTLNGGDTIESQTEALYHLDTAGTYRIAFTRVFGNGCFKQQFWDVKVRDGRLRASVTQPKQCIPAPITLVDSSWTPGAIPRSWHFSNGDKLKVTATEMTYMINKVYADTLVVTLKNDPDTGSCRPVMRFYIPVSGPGVNMNWAWNSLSCTDLRFVANAFINPDKGTAPFTILWNMGDGKNYSSQFVTHKYSDTGWYTVTLTVTDSRGCKSVISENIYVPENRLNVKIAADTSGSACPPLYVSFRDLSTSSNIPIKSWEWDFGDGSGSKQKNPKHQYVVPGRFTVSLKVTDEQGCTRTVKFPDFILVNGPYGKFRFDNPEGCYPLKIKFEDSTNAAATKAEWDFGDGVVKSGFDPAHTYTRPGRYIPALVLSDSLGCKYPVPPFDTVWVYDYPEASFVHQGICLHDSVQLQSTAVTRDYPIEHWRWLTADGKVFGSDSAMRTLFSTKINQVQHIVSTEKGCSDTVKGWIRLKQPDISISGTDDTICLGGEWQGTFRVTADTGLLEKYWLLNGSYYSDNENIRFQPTSKGLYHFAVFARDAAGCRDTMPAPGPVAAGDTLEPPVLHVLRTSVESDISHHILFRSHPDFDFKKYSIFRFEGGDWNKVAEISRRQDTLIYLNGVDALKYSYCYVASTTNLCGYSRKPATLLPHCTVELRGKPDTNASVLNWNAYTGWPVKDYVIYRENSEIPGRFDSLAQVPGSQLTYTDSSIICYTTHYYRVKALEQGGNREWSFSDTCRVSPWYFNLVPAPAIRRATVVDDRFVRLEWDEVRANRQPLDYFAVEKLDARNQWRWMMNSKVTDSFVLHDMKTLVDDYSYLYRLRAVDVCDDTSGYSNPGKSILLQTSLNEQFRPVLQWTAYREWPEGVKQYVVEKRNANGAFEEIGRTESGTDTAFTDLNSSLNCVPIFEYRVYAVRNAAVNNPWSGLRSYSNISGPAAETKIFVPNAFTPNDNAMNESFRPDGIFIASYVMKIYNRWGEKVYEGKECMNAWNGWYQGEPAPEGVYIYLIDARGVDGRRYVFKGDVSLLR